MITRKRCALCQHEDREELEAALEGGFISCDDLDKREGWRSGTAAQHMRNHMGDYTNLADVYDMKPYGTRCLKKYTKIL